MLSPEERDELTQMAGSAALREEFRRLKAAARFDPNHLADRDRFIRFLTFMSRVTAVRPTPRLPIRETCLLL